MSPASPKDRKVYILSYSGELSVKAKGTRNRFAEHNLKLVGLIPADPAVNELDALGEPIVRLPEDAPIRRSLAAILASLNGGL